MAVPLSTLDLAYEAALDYLKSGKTLEAALAATNDTVSRITSRVFRRGLDSDLNKFSPYTASYAEIRKEASRQTSYKDFIFSGRTFSSVQTLQSSFSNLKNIVVIDSNNELGQDIISGQSQREGKPILAPTAQEIQQAGQTYVNEVVRRLERFFVQ